VFSTDCFPVLQCSSLLTVRVLPVASFCTSFIADLEGWIHFEICFLTLGTKAVFPAFAAVGVRCHKGMWKQTWLSMKCEVCADEGGEDAFRKQQSCFGKKLNKGSVRG